MTEGDGTTTQRNGKPIVNNPASRIEASAQVSKEFLGDGPSGFDVSALLGDRCAVVRRHAVVAGSRRVAVALVSLLIPLAMACNGSEAATTESQPARTVVADAGASSTSPSPSPSLSTTATPVTADTGTSQLVTTESTDVAGALESAVSNGLDTFRGAVLVASGDEVLLSKGYGAADVAAGIPNDASTRFRIGSVTKQFTGLATLILRDQGLLDVTGSVCDYLTPCPATWQPITLENLVSHTSGIPDYTGLADFEATKAAPTTPDALVARFRDLPLERAPGGVFSYSNSNYAVLGAVIEHVSGMAYQDYLRATIFEPLGMSDTGYETKGDGLAVGYIVSDEEADAIDMSVAYAAGALSSTVADLFLWNQAIASGTAAPGEATTDMLTPIETTTDNGGFGYGYGIYVSTSDDAPLAFHDGGIDGFSAVLMNDIRHDITVIILSNTNNSGDIVSAARQLRGIVLAG